MRASRRVTLLNSWTLEGVTRCIETDKFLMEVAVDDFGNTPLIFACKTKNWDIAMALIEAGADVNATNFGLWTALMYAVIAVKVEVANALLHRGAAVDQRDEVRPILLALPFSTSF